MAVAVDGHAPERTAPAAGPGAPPAPAGSCAATPARGAPALVKRGELWHSSAPVLLALPLAAVLGLSSPAPALEIRSASVDPARADAGLRARVGDDLGGWTIAVDDTADPGLVAVRLQAPDGRVVERQLALTGLTEEERSRELAASLALLMELPAPAPGPTPGPEPPPDPAPESTPPPDPPPPPPPRAFVALAPRVELGRGLLVDGGGALEAGAWLLRDHLQPLVSLGASAARQAGIDLLHLRFGAGLAVGAPLPRNLWLGGHLLVHALWLRASDDRTGAAWSSSSDLGALLQYRGRRLYLGLRTGVDLTLPPLHVTGQRAEVRRGPARWFVGLGIGLLFGG